MSATAKQSRARFPPNPRTDKWKEVATPRPSRLREYYPSPDHQTWFNEWERRHRKPKHLETVPLLNAIKQLMDRSPAQEQIFLLFRTQMATQAPFTTDILSSSQYCLALQREH